MKEFLNYFTWFFDGAILIYVILIISSYLLLAYYSGKALIEYLRVAKFINPHELMSSPLSPSVSLIAPAYNEANTIVENVRSLLAIQYPKLEVIIVNDGSKDDTLKLLIAAYDLIPSNEVVHYQIKAKEIRTIYKSSKPVYENLKVIDKANGGKADALNCGLNVATSEYIACIDVDCVLAQDAVIKMIQPFLSGATQCIATGGVIRIANSCIIEDGRLVDVVIPGNLLARFQVLEYIRAFLMGRMGWSKADGLLLISGAFGIFNKEIAIKAGGYDHNTVGEDMELIVRMRRYMIERKLKYRVEFIPDPLCWTEAPSTYKVLGRQRNRWMRGTIETLLQHKVMFFNPKYKVLGMLSYPYWLFFEWLAPLIEIVGLLYFLILLLLGQPNFIFSLSLFALVYAFALFMSTLAILFDEFTFYQYKRKRDVLRLLLVALIEPFVHHPMVVRWGIQGNMDFLKGKKKLGRDDKNRFYKEGNKMKFAWFLVWSFRIVFFTVLLTPIIMFLVWLFQPARIASITIIDKTVLDQNYEEHESLFWYLNYHKWLHPNTEKRYQSGQDYFGFFPKKGKKYKTRGLEGKPIKTLDSLAASSTFLYLTDTYGIYHNEWYQDGDEKERSEHLYGGLAKEDLYLLQKMDVTGKTILAEFNTIANPTKVDIRQQFEDQFDLKWTGWIGRNFESLDTVQNKELPRWLIQNYLKQYGKWPFKQPGIVFVNENDRIEILELGSGLYESVPIIYTHKSFATESGVDPSLFYPFWFDIMEIGPELEALAYYHIPTTPAGDSLLKQYNIPYFFPAVMRRKPVNDKAAFYYFAGDFCDNPINKKRSYFKGITFISEFFYDEKDNSDRLTFFYRYYLPLLDVVLKN